MSTQTKLTTPTPGLRLVVAVHAEARPLVDHYRLRRDPASRLAVYDGEVRIAGATTNISLVVSGVGKTAAASATGYLAAIRQSAPLVWLNVGIVGHRSHRIGDGYTVHRIHDASTGRHFFPSLVGCQLESRSVVTVDRPERKFASEDLYEMEASAFYESALSFATTELIQCYKIVSDNLLSPADALTKESISGLVEENLDGLDRLAESFLNLATHASTQSHEPRHLEDFVARWHFTHTQRTRLHHLLKRAELLLDAPVEIAPFEKHSLGRQVLQDLEELLELAVLRKHR